jgi:hypothetical protein
MQRVSTSAFFLMRLITSCGDLRRPGKSPTALP